MECPQCRHVSSEKAPKFCSECGQRLSPVATVQDLENNNALVVASTPEGKTEQGEVLREEEVLLSSTDSSKELRNPEESATDASWTTQMEVDPEVFVDASEDTAGGPEGAQCSSSKRKKEETAGCEVVDTEQSKKEKRRRRRQGTISSPEAPSSGLWSLDMPSSPGSHDSALPQNQAQQGGAASQPGHSLDPENTPMKKDGSVHAEGSGSPQQGQAAEGTGTQSNLAPSDHKEVKDLNTSKPSVDKGLALDGGPALSAFEGDPKMTDASQKAPLPESKGEISGQEKKVLPIDAAANPVKKAGKETRDDAQKQKPSPVSPAASKDGDQEAELKGKLATPVSKSSESGSTQPEDQKKPGENRNYAAAVKNKSQQAATPEDPSALNPWDSVTVYFHAIVSHHFGFNPDEHRVCVRGGDGLGQKGWTDACEMYYTRDLHDLGSLVEGKMDIPRQSLDKPIPYKYVIHRGGSGKDTVEYEFIYEPAQKKGEHVNRCLQVPSAFLGQGDWHQYDDIICMKSPGWIQTAKNHFTDGTRKELVRGKKQAAAVMLDRILSVLQPWNAINLQSFMTQFRQFYSVVREPKIHDGRARKWSSLQYEEREVKMNLWEHVKKHMGPFLEGKSGESLPADCPVRSKLTLGLSILFMVEAADFTVPKKDLDALCYLLIPSAGSPEALRSDLGPVLSISQRWRMYLTNLCHRCIEEKYDRWLGILPLLHHCMQQSLPRKNSKSQPEDTWAGLEVISFSEFRDKASARGQALQFMQNKMALLHVDEYLFRSWFSLVPLESLTSYMGNFIEYLSLVPTRVLDCFQGIAYRLRGLGRISHQNVEDVEKIFKMLMSLMEMYQDRIFGENLSQIYLTECLTLHETVCNITAHQQFFEIPALSADLICEMLKLSPSGHIVEGLAEKPYEDLVMSTCREALDTTRNWLRSTFKSRMLSCSATVRLTYHNEMAVWRRLVEINFPDKYGWKESLLGDMEGRFKQESPRVQISFFCSSQWRDSGIRDSVARSFEKCVIEAVSSACQVTSLSSMGLRGF